MTRSIFRPHDDNDGDRSQGLVVAESPDGDLWVYVQGEPVTALRFRMPFIGGGRSPHTWEALKVLQDAMERDNAPQSSLPLAIDWEAQHPDRLLRTTALGGQETGGELDVAALAAEVLALRQRVRWTEHLRALTTPADDWI